MTHHYPDDDPVRASLEFDEKLRNSSAYLEMHTTLKRRTWVGIILSFLLAVNIALGSVAISAAFNADHAISQQRDTCLSGNDYRTHDHSTWEFAISLLAPKPRSAETQHKVNEFNAHIDKTDALRDCKNIN